MTESKPDPTATVIVTTEEVKVPPAPLVPRDIVATGGVSCVMQSGPEKKEADPCR